MSRALLALLVLLAADALLAQRRGGTTRAPGRSGPIPGVGVPPLVLRGEHQQGRPIRPGPIPLPSPRRTWVRIETPHFTILSSAGARATRTIAHDLERLTALLIRTSDSFRLPEARTRVFLFGDPRDVQPYFDAARGMRVDAAGATVRHPDGSTILIDVSARGGEALTPRHEVVHDLLRNNARPLPLWLEEGLAEHYSNAGLPIAEHVSRLRRARMPIPLEELFALHHQSPRAASWDFYAESWGAVTALLRRDPNAFRELVRDLERGVPVTEALRSRYRMTARDLENAMRRAGVPTRSILSSGVTLDLEPQRVDYPELVFELGELLVRLPDRHADAARHFRVARPYLETASPERVDVAFAMFVLSLSDGEREKTDALFPRLANTSRGHATRKILLDTDFARADALARDGRLLEAARILRELAPKMPEHARLNLEAQAAELEALSSTRR